MNQLVKLDVIDKYNILIYLQLLLEVIYPHKYNSICHIVICIYVLIYKYILCTGE